ncbi:hypothetical protein ACF0H5_001360 [Mactra antiquata]
MLLVCAVMWNTRKETKRQTKDNIKKNHRGGTQDKEPFIWRSGEESGRPCGMEKFCVGHTLRLKRRGVS